MSASPPPPVHLVRTGIANIEAVSAAFRRLGRDVVPVRAPDEIAEAAFVVLPGVGSFASGIEALERAGLLDPLRQRVESGRPTLAICLGLQLLCEGSAEAPDVGGLGCIPGRTGRFDGEVRVPQLGWNAIRTDGEGRFLQSGVMYFANSYRLAASPPGWAEARSRHGSVFVAGLERRGVLACQFHPELSGVAGAGLLERWLERAPAAARAVEGAEVGAPDRSRVAC